MAHAQATDGIKTAVRAGIRSIEHGIYLDDEAIELMLDRGTWLVPTLVAPRGVLAAAEAGVPIPEASRRKARRCPRPTPTRSAGPSTPGSRWPWAPTAASPRTATTCAELELMAEGGMAPAQALVATTSSAAELLGVDDELGTLEPGKRADLVVVDGDPFELATIGDRIAAVVKDGRLVAGHL